MNKEELKKVFRDYVFNNYDMKDIGISRKYYHSLRVMDIAEKIAIENNFSNSDIELSVIIGLFHDYARFPQWKKYKTYNDLRSIDHGDLGVKLLFDNNEIEKFNIKKEYYDEIYDAIKYHNKMDIIDDLSVHNNLLCKLIRDADKLDIFYLYGTDNTLFNEDNMSISEGIKNDFYNKKQIDRTLVNCKNDNIILDISMVFDLNFDYSYKYIRENKLIEKMWDKINNKEMFKEYFDYINKYIDERID